MRASRLSLKRSLLLSTLFSLTLLSAGVLAQDDTTTASTTASATTTSENTETSATATETTTSATTTAAATTSTATDDGTTTSDSSMPTLSGDSTSSNSRNSDMPTLSSTTAVDTSVPTYPAASVPPTQNAPYMQTSSMPDGTVFIAVGSILGAFGLAILLWRAIIACLLHRSVEKAAMAQHHANDKAIFPAPPAPFYKYTDHDSSQNVTPGRGVRRSNRGPVPSATPSQTNLFFSPTAAGGANPRDSTYRDTPNRESTYRDSRFLPAGFYAAGTSSPHNVDANESSISLNNLRPDRHARGMSGRTPPESPGFGPQRSPMPQDISSSSVNLHSAPTGRAPSAYLDDLLGDHPEMFPPSSSSTTPPGTNNSNHPYRQSGRF